MNTPVENNRWTANPETFAACVQVGDVSGFFANRLTIEPGTRALIIDDGEYLGDVGPGTYTLESFAEKLRFWRKKQATAILTRQEDLTVELTTERIPTSEHLTVDATVRITAQVEDVALFSRNLMGTRPEYSTRDLCQAIQPIIDQALWETLGAFSITDLTGPEVRQTIDAGIEQALGLAMRRYGLRFISVQTVSINHEKYDELRDKLGDQWLLQEEIKAQETANELEALAENVEVDKEESDVAIELRRVGVRNQLREAVLSEKFDIINNEEELKRFILERDKGQLLREEELDELTNAFQQRKDDRQSARKHLVAKLDLERDFDIEKVRSELDHARLVKTREHEIELTKLTATEENLKWQQELDREVKQAEHRRTERRKELEDALSQARVETAHRREEEWDDIVHKQRMSRMEGDLEVAQSERKLRVARLEIELKETQETAQLELDKRRAEWETELAGKTFQNQMEKLQAVQALNREAERHALELKKEQESHEVELALLKEDRAHERQLALITVRKGMTLEELVATSDGDNAIHLVDLKKHEITSQTELAKAQQSNDAALAEANAKSEMSEKLTTVSSQHAKELLEAQQKAAELQQQTFQQALAAMGNMGQGQQPMVVMPGVQPGATVPVSHVSDQPEQSKPNRVVVCPKCRAENLETARHCSGCGEKL